TPLGPPRRRTPPLSTTPLPGPGSHAKAETAEVAPDRRTERCCAALAARRHTSDRADPLGYHRMRGTSLLGPHRLAGVPVGRRRRWGANREPTGGERHAPPLPPEKLGARPPGATAGHRSRTEPQLAPARTRIEPEHPPQHPRERPRLVRDRPTEVG